jgi:hypothetical protein
MKFKLLSGILILGMILGSVITFAFFKPGKKDIDVVIPGQIISTILSEVEKTQKIIEGIDFTTYVVKTEKDTFYYDSTALYGNIPVIETSWQDKFSLTIDNKLEFIYFKETIMGRGEILKRDIELYPTTFRISLRSPSLFRFYGNIGVGYCNNNCIPVMAELGIIAKKRYSLSGIILRTDETYYGGMFRVWF